MNPKVSVIMGVYNIAGKPLPGIESMLTQDFDNYEIVIVNDGSTDGTQAILEEYAQRDSRVRVVHAPTNLGLAAGLNRAICHAQADFVMRMDFDDWAYPHRMRRQYEFMMAHPQIGIAGCAFDKIRPDGQSVGIIRMPTEHQAIMRQLPLSSPFCHPSTMIRRECFFRYGFYNPLFREKEDYELWLRWRPYVTFANMDEVLLRYDWGPSDTSEREKLRRRSYWKLYKYDHWARWLNFPNSPTKWRDLYGWARIQVWYLVWEPLHRMIKRLRRMNINFSQGTKR